MSWCGSGASSVSSTATSISELLPEISSEDTDFGWGDEEPAVEEAAGDARLAEDRPPHHDRGW